MFTTLVAVISVLAFVLPGFVIADLQRRKRATVAAGSDWEVVLRALSYSLILHLIVSPWTRCLVLKIDEGDWHNHLESLVCGKQRQRPAAPLRDLGSVSCCPPNVGVGRPDPVRARSRMAS